jgi:hypothetical protein
VARPIRRAPRDNSRRRLWVYLAVIAILLVDAVLVVTALSANEGLDTGDMGPVPSFTSTPSAIAPAPVPPVVEPVETTITPGLQSS